MVEMAASRARLSDILKEAFANLHSQGLRSFLALLGILIGTASIVAMLSIGHLAQIETLKMFKGMGVDMITLRVTPNGPANAGFRLADIEALPGTHADVLSAVPLSYGSVNIQSAKASTSIGLIAITPEFQNLLGWRLSDGRFFSDIDDGRPVTILGHDLAVDLSAPGAQILPGSLVRVGDYSFTVVGILAPLSREALSQADFNTSIFIPLRGAQRLLPSDQPNTALVRLRPGARTEIVGPQLQTALSSADYMIKVQSAQDMIEAMNRQKATFSTLLSAIGGISLLVGGIGVMNVMLMSVMERRKEIGLRAAIGATPRDIQMMFMIEAAALSFAGGLGGVVLGILIAFGVALYTGWPFDLALYVLPLGPGVAATVGMVFGFQPALHASRLDPIEALRAE